MATMQLGVNLSENIGPAILAADIATKVLAAVAVILRFVARRVNRASLWWDDWLILLTLAFVVASMPIEIIEIVSYSIGRHIGYVAMTSPDTLSVFHKLIYVDNIFYSIDVGCIKSSILFLYIRLFGVKRGFAWICYIQIGLVIIWAIVTEFLFIFRCSPIWVALYPLLQAGKCMDYAPLFIGTNTVNVIMDFGILITPIPCIWSLKLSVQKKILVTGALMLGGAELAFSTTRVVKISALTFEDTTWDDAVGLFWSVIEINLGMLCACIPVMAPLLPNGCLGRSGNGSGPGLGSGGRPIKPKPAMRAHLSSGRTDDVDGHDERQESERPDGRGRALAGSSEHMAIERKMEFSVHEAPSPDLTARDKEMPWPHEGYIV